MLTQKQKIGKIGENIAAKYLKKQGFKILERNYRKKWGEIDIIAEKSEPNFLLGRFLKANKILHFIEVKSIAYSPDKNFIPEENVRLWKRKRLSRAIRTYLSEKNISDKIKYQIDIMAIFIDLNSKKAKIRKTENIIL
jgi:putative endonuclease